MTTQLLIASNNLHKISELRALFKEHALPIDLYSLRNFPKYQSPLESGDTFYENALIKASCAVKEFGMMALSDDSGLVVPSLNDDPGVHSAYYAGMEATDRENRQKLLESMRGLQGLERSAYFQCTLILLEPGKDPVVFEGKSEGTILESERGSHGFGYDALFLKHGYSKTFAEMDDRTKNRTSHRGKAFDKLLTYLKEHYCSL